MGVLYRPRLAAAAYALVAHTFAGSSDNNNVTTSAIDTTGASLLVVGIGYAHGVTMTVTDSKSNSWTNDAVFPTSTATVENKLVYTRNPSSVGSGHTFTCSSSGGFPSICVAAFSGGDTTSDRDQADTKATTTGSTITAGATGITPSQDNEVLVTGMSMTIVGATVSIDGGFSVLDQIAGDATHHFGTALAYLIQTTATAANPTWTVTGSTEARTAGIWSFKAAAAGTTSRKRGRLF